MGSLATNFLKGAAACVGFSAIAWGYKKLKDDKVPLKKRLLPAVASIALGVAVCAGLLYVIILEADALTKSPLE